MRTLFSSLHLQLSCFEGPLDVFVHLIYRREMNSHLISLQETFGKISTQLVDFESASHFLEQFTLLMLFKSRECLPFEEHKPATDLAAPQEAIIHLSDYYKFKEIAYRLDQKQEEEACRYLKGSRETIPLLPPQLEQISIEQLQSLFQKVLERLPKENLIQKDAYSLQEGKQLIYNSLKKGTFDLFNFLTELETKEMLIVTFLAILEMMKEGEIFVRSDYQVEAREVAGSD